MNKLSKIFLVIILILVIALGIMTYLYFNMRENAKYNLEELLKSAEEHSKQIEELNVEIANLENQKLNQKQNISEEDLKRELLKNLSLPDSNLMIIDIKEIKSLKSPKEAIVTITANIEDNQGENHAFDIDVKFTEKTVYTSRGNQTYNAETLKYAMGNINDLRLDDQTLDNEYPEVLEFNSTDT